MTLPTTSTSMVLMSTATSVFYKSVPLGHPEGFSKCLILISLIKVYIHCKEFKTGIFACIHTKFKDMKDYNILTGVLQNEKCYEAKLHIYIDKNIFTCFIDGGSAWSLIWKRGFPGLGHFSGFFLDWNYTENYNLSLLSYLQKEPLAIHPNISILLK